MWILSFNGKQHEWILNSIKSSFNINCHCFIPQHVFIPIAHVLLSTGAQTIFHFGTVHCYIFLTKGGATFFSDAACTLLKVPEVIFCVLKKIRKARDKKETENFLCNHTIRTNFLLPFVAATTSAAN